jgi:ABC-2 type transport system ATP-binding protein
MENLGVTVVEVESSDLQAIKRRLETLEGVFSAAQIGSRLRVQIENSISDPVDFLRNAGGLGAENRIAETRPNLEDVFVYTTRGNP